MILIRSFRLSRAAAMLFFAVAIANQGPLLHAKDGTSAAGFNLRKPRVFVGGHVGFNMPRANSDLFDMVTRELTLEKSDFRAATFGGDFGIPIASNFAVVLSFDYARSKTNSESRDYVEDNGDPIVQTTRFTQVPFTATFRYYPRKMGESVGSYAWIPTRFNPYAAVGVGALHYKFEQFGRFVDSTTLNIFKTSLQSSGFVATEHVGGGIDISLTPMIFLNGEARYSWADADLSRDFTGFDPISLSGFKILGGVNFRF